MTISTWRDFTIVNSCDRKLRETNPRNCNAPCYHKICKQPTINRDCLIRFEHQQLLSIPKGYIYVGDRKNESDFRKCSEEKNKKIVDKNVYSQITDFLSVKSKFQNKVSELDILCLIFKNLKPECESSTWKQRFTITLTYTLMKIITKDISSYQTLRSKHISTLTLKRLNRITGEQTSITSPKNKLQHVQVYLANALTPWLERPINQICSDVKEKKQFDDQNKKSKAKFQVLTKRNLYYSKKGKNIDNTSERLIHNGLIKVSKKENFKKLIGELNDKNLNLNKNNNNNSDHSNLKYKKKKIYKKKFIESNTKNVSNNMKVNKKPEDYEINSFNNYNANKKLRIKNTHSSNSYALKFKYSIDRIKNSRKCKIKKKNKEFKDLHHRMNSKQSNLNHKSLAKQKTISYEFLLSSRQLSSKIRSRNNNNIMQKQNNNFLTAEKNINEKTQIIDTKKKISKSNSYLKYSGFILNNRNSKDQKLNRNKKKTGSTKITNMKDNKKKSNSKNSKGIKRIPINIDKNIIKKPITNKRKFNNNQTSDSQLSNTIIKNKKTKNKRKKIGINDDFYKSNNKQTPNNNYIINDRDLNDIMQEKFGRTEEDTKITSGQDVDITELKVIKSEFNILKSNNENINEGKSSKVDNKNLKTVEIDGKEINTNKIGENGEKNLTAKENKINDLNINNTDKFGGINSKETHGEKIINNKPDIHSTKSKNKKNVEKESNILTLNRLGETEYFNKYMTKSQNIEEKIKNRIISKNIENTDKNLFKEKTNEYRVILKSRTLSNPSQHYVKHEKNNEDYFKIDEKEITKNYVDDNIENRNEINTKKISTQTINLLKNCYDEKAYKHCILKKSQTINYRQTVIKYRICIDGTSNYILRKIELPYKTDNENFFKSENISNFTIESKCGISEKYNTFEHKHLVKK